jgi:hypothetical protein
MDGIKYIFTDLYTYSQKCVSLDNIIYLSFFNTLLEKEVNAFHKDLDNLYITQKSFSEYFLERYFYNKFSKNILVEIFSSSLISLFSICNREFAKGETQGKIGPKGKTIVEMFEDVKDIFLDPNNLSKGIEFRKEVIDDILVTMRNFLNDLETNILKIPVYVFYCFKKLKQGYYRTTDNDEKSKLKIKQGLMRLFFKNLVAKQIKNLFAENYLFIGQLLGCDPNPDENSLEAILLKHFK